MDFDIFAETPATDVRNDLRARFVEPPFSILDTKSGSWRARVDLWKSLGMKSEVGRDVKTYTGAAASLDFYRVKEGTRASSVELPTSIFDPALCEVLYRWFCPDNGTILDPFAGGSVRGIVAHKLGYKYTGIDIRPEQIDSNRDQALSILGPSNMPTWIVGDSNKELDALTAPCDFFFSCPPYADLEVYSKREGDISNMPYREFLEAYRSIISKCCKLLKPGALACFVVGEVRGKDGNYIGFVPDTVLAFTDAGMGYYNEAILANTIASASMRAGGNMKSRKLVKVHQNILVFKKPT